MNNHAYDIVKAVTKKADAVWVYDQYLKDSQNCQTCQKLWEKLKDEDEKHLKQLKTALTSHDQAGLMTP